jgi:dihydropteridine reductase
LLTKQEGGLFVLTGASGALKPTPTLVAYGVTKVACHHLVESLAAPDSGMPKDSVTTAILPIMLDTPMNRRDMPTANFDDWTPLDVVAQQLVDWSKGNGRPKNGSLIQIKTQNKKTEFVPIN